MDGEKIDAEAVEAWRPPVADAATDDDGGEVQYTGCSCELGGVNDDGTRCVECDGFGMVAIVEGDGKTTRPQTDIERTKVSRDLGIFCDDDDEPDAYEGSQAYRERIMEMDPRHRDQLLNGRWEPRVEPDDLDLDDIDDCDPADDEPDFVRDWVDED
jgi:hypothetical protein